MAYSFTTSTDIGAPRELVFATELNVDFHRNSFAHTGVEAIDGVLTGEMALGDTVTWRAQHLVHWFVH